MGSHVDVRDAENASGRDPPPDQRSEVDAEASPPGVDNGPYVALPAPNSLPTENVFTWTTRSAWTNAISPAIASVARHQRWTHIARDDDAPHESVMRCWRLCPAWDEMRSFPRS